MTNSQLELMQSKIVVKDRQIKNLETQKSVLLEKDTIRIEQLRTQETIIKDTETIVKKVKAKNTFWKITAILALISSGTLLIVK